MPNKPFLQHGHQWVTVLHRGPLNAPGPSLRWPKSHASSCSSALATATPSTNTSIAKPTRAGWRDRTKARSQQHPLKFDVIYFSPLCSSQADNILCKPKRTIQNIRNNEPKGCNISGKKNENQSKRSHPESSGCFALQTAHSSSLQHHPSSCSVTQRLRPGVL